jgi:Zn finger protein HypA/HybF involved in hydrogenase expression
MENKEVKIKCYKCGESYTSAMMRYDPMNPSRLICRNCLGKKDQKAASTSASGGKPKVEEGSVKYYCIKCRYKFSRKKNIVVETCPYCGSDNLTTKTDANSILKKAGDEDFER